MGAGVRDAFPPPMCVGLHSFICVWKRRYADVRAGTQAPPLRISFGWIARGAVLFVGKTVHMNQHHRCCTFASPGLPTIGGYPGKGRRERTYAIGIVLFKINFRVEKSFANNPFAAV